mmetsp:Transcript_80482/g.167694  ORF Transcript_80482/g.167694 Transcript_80482/m.167694 type:complete len:83 (+) Transcript_80482:4917-5165(+)
MPAAATNVAAAVLGVDILADGGTGLALLNGWPVVAEVTPTLASENTGGEAETDEAAEALSGGCRADMRVGLPSADSVHEIEV